MLFIHTLIHHTHYLSHHRVLLFTCPPAFRVLKKTEDMSWQERSCFTLTQGRQQSNAQALLSVSPTATKVLPPILVSP